MVFEERATPCARWRRTQVWLRRRAVRRCSERSGLHCAACLTRN